MTMTTKNRPATTQNPLAIIRQEFISNRKAVDAAAAIAGLDGDQLIGAFLIHLQRNPDLFRCEPLSLVDALKEAASQGLTIGGLAAQAYLVPFNDNKTKTTRAKLIPSYRGMMALARRDSVADFRFGAVHPGEAFGIDMFPDANNRPISHRHGLDRTPGNYTHVYCVAKLKDGTWATPLVMTRDEIEQHRRKYSPTSGPDTPWQQEPEKMAIKTVIKRYCAGGYVPLATPAAAIVRRATDVDPLAAAEYLDPAPIPARRLDAPTTPPAAALTVDDIRRRFAGTTTTAELEAELDALYADAGDDETALGRINEESNKRYIQITEGT